MYSSHYSYILKRIIIIDFLHTHIHTKGCNQVFFSIFLNAEQADESVGNTSRSEPPQQTAPSLPGDSSADHRPSGNVESEAGWRPPPQFLEAATTGFASLEAHREPDREAEKNPEQDLSTVDENVAEEEEKEVESVKDSSSRSTSRRRTHPPLSPYRPGRPWRPGLPTGWPDHC